MSDADNEDKSGAQPRTPMKQLLSCGVGSVSIDLIRQTSSLGLLFYMRVAGLTSSQTGLIVVAGKISHFTANVVFGYCCDRVDVPLLSRKLGRRKSWHLLATIFLVFSFMASFSRCFVCTELSSSWKAFAFFFCAFTIRSFFYGAVQISHLSIIPGVAKNQDEGVTLSFIR